MPSAWILHVKKYQQEHGVSYKEAMMKSKHTYQKKENCPRIEQKCKEDIDYRDNVIKEKEMEIEALKKSGHIRPTSSSHAKKRIWLETPQKKKKDKVPVWLSDLQDIGLSPVNFNLEHSANKGRKHKHSLNPI